jgi:hypothetical protein
MKISMTPSGIQPATFRFIVQYHCATAVLIYLGKVSYYDVTLMQSRNNQYQKKHSYAEDGGRFLRNAGKLLTY